PPLSRRPRAATKAAGARCGDRKAELSLLREAVQAGTNALVVGDRGAGKTSLLYRLAVELDRTALLATVVDGRVPTDPASLLEMVAFRVQGPHRPAVVTSRPLGSAHASPDDIELLLHRL